MNTEDIIDINHIGVPQPTIKVEDKDDLFSIHKNTSLQFFNQVLPLKHKKRKPRSRSKYTILTREEKIKCLNDLKKYGKNEVAYKYGVDKQTLNKWLIYGIERKKKSGRRPLTYHLERQLKEWCESMLKIKKIISIDELKDKAIELGGNKKLIESSEWLDKFKKRNNIKLGIISIKNDNYY